MFEFESELESGSVVLVLVRVRASACFASISGDNALTTVWIVSAWNSEGNVVADESVCNAMEPGKWPPAIIAVTPGSKSVWVSVRK